MITQPEDHKAKARTSQSGLRLLNMASATY